MSQHISIGLFGNGRLGRAIMLAADNQIAWQVTRAAPPKERVDVAIEASNGSTVAARVEWALATGTPLVIGSTGWEMPDLTQRVSDRIGVLIAPNFSLSVALLRRFSLVLARFCALDERRDPYLIEQHHARKHDAPSGTAKLLAQTVIAGCPRKHGYAIGGPIQPSQLSVSVVRAGTNYSEHTVGMAAPHEVIDIHHLARGADAFGDGAIAAAHWITKRRGVHTMDEVAASVLDPLFQGLSGGHQ